MNKKETTAIDETTQPSGIDLSKTLWVVNEMLTDPAFCEEVKKHNGWPQDMSPDRAALLFLSARYQTAVELLVRRTDHLHALATGNTNRIAVMEDVVFAK